jgi:ketosteroid isomerase-like protein
MTRGLHPAAVAATSAEARRGRAPADWLYTAYPPATRLVFRAILRLPRSRLRTGLLTYAVKRGYAAFNRRDWELNTVLHHPTAHRWDAGGMGVGPMDVSDLRDVEGYVAGLSRYLEAWGDLRLVVEEVIEVGADRVLVMLRQVATGAGSGVPVEMPSGDLLTFRDGWLVDQKVTMERDDALRSAGLDPG